MKSISSISNRGRTVTFMFTDIEGSTKLLQELGDEYEKVLRAHHKILRDSIKRHHGKEIDTAGDGFFIVFNKVRDAVNSAAEIQKNISRKKFVRGVSVNVRIGVHTGEALKARTGYVGIDVHRASRVAASGHGGQLLISESTKVLLGKYLPAGTSIKDLGEYLLKDLEKPEHLFQVDIIGLKNEFPPIKSTREKKDNLPARITKLIGRDKEIKELSGLILSKEVCLVTLTGPGGIGKTSLALTLGNFLVDKFKDGVYLTSLANVMDSGHVAAAISQAVGINENVSVSVEKSLIDFLKHREVLLIVDNFEHLMDASDVIGLIAEQCSFVKIIVTSRQVLNLRSETEYQVTELKYPVKHEHFNLQSASKFPAVRLFFDRAKSVDKSFRLTKKNLAAIPEICKYTGGLPLAIELAAAAIRMFDPETILSRLENKVSVLKSQKKDIEERHRTLENAISWSYDLLSEDEKNCFRWFSIFNGGMSLDAAQYILNGMNGRKLHADEIISDLISKSLLQKDREQNLEPRYFMIPALKTFARELIHAGEKHILKQHHADFFYGIAIQAKEKLQGPEMKTWIDKLQIEKSNIRSSLRYAVENGELKMGMEICTSIYKFWRIKRLTHEGLEIMEQFLHDAGSGNYPLVRAEALYSAGAMLQDMELFGRSLPYLQESYSIYQQHADDKGMLNNLICIAKAEASSLNTTKAIEIIDTCSQISEKLGDLGSAASSIANAAATYFYKGNYKQSAIFFEKAIVLREKIGDKRAMSLTLCNFSWINIHMGNFEEAERLLKRAESLLKDLSILEDTNYYFRILTIYYIAKGEYEHAENELSRIVFDDAEESVYERSLLGHIKHLRKKFDESESMLNEGRKYYSDTYDSLGLAFVNTTLGYLLYDQGKFEYAGRLFREALELRIKGEDIDEISESLDSIASVMNHEGKHKDAALLLRHAEMMRERVGSIPFAYQMKRIRKDVKIIRNGGLGKFLTEGENLKLDALVEIAMK